MKKNRLRWFGYVQRRSINEPIRKKENYNLGDLEGERGRPKMTWRQK